MNLAHQPKIFLSIGFICAVFSLFAFSDLIPQDPIDIEECAYRMSCVREKEEQNLRKRISFFSPFFIASLSSFFISFQYDEKLKSLTKELYRQIEKYDSFILSNEVAFKAQVSTEEVIVLIQYYQESGLIARNIIVVRGDIPEGFD